MANEQGAGTPGGGCLLGCLTVLLVGFAAFGAVSLFLGFQTEHGSDLGGSLIATGILGGLLPAGGLAFGVAALNRRVSAQRSAAIAEANRRYAEEQEAERRRSAEAFTEAQFARAGELLARITLARGPADRRRLLRQGLQELTDAGARLGFVRDAARTELQAAHEKAGRLKSRDAKLRVYQATLDEMRADDVPDEEQAEVIAELEALVRDLSD